LSRRLVGAAAVAAAADASSSGLNAYRSRASAVDPPANASDAAYKVYRKHDAVAGDGHEQYTELYDRVVAQHSDIAAKVKIGESVLGRDIVAIQVTRNAQGVDNGKPAVLYNALQHAREWLAGETCKRTLDRFTRLYGKDRQVTRLVNERQLWFVCVNNPDGNEFTFTPTRDTVYAGFELGTLSNADRTSFFGEVLEYFDLKTE
jgi:murein tripeptide amidase MpaA